MLQTGGVMDRDNLRRKAMAAAGKLNDTIDLAANHDNFLAEALD
jgi:hypothetical protein